MTPGLLVLLSAGFATRSPVGRPEVDLVAARSEPPGPRPAPELASRTTPPAFAATPATTRPREPAADDQAEQAYRAALTTYRGQAYGQAVLDFLDFIGRYPRHPLAGNAQYWIGEAYYAQHDYRQALVEFHKVGAVAPGSPKVADALLRAGFCHRHLRDDARARQTWQRLIQDFPRSEAAVKARALLRSQSGAAPR